VDGILVTETKKKLVNDYFEVLRHPSDKSDDDGIWLDQEATIEEMLIKFNLQDANSVRLPIGADYEENK
jgi:hypothetical protein